MLPDYDLIKEDINKEVGVERNCFPYCFSNFVTNGQVCLILLGNHFFQMSPLLEQF